MFGFDNPIHLLFLLVLLLLVFGAKRLPEMGKSLGAGLRGFKESINGEDHVSAIAAEPESPAAAQPGAVAGAERPAAPQPAPAGPLAN